MLESKTSRGTAAMSEAAQAALNRLFEMVAGKQLLADAGTAGTVSERVQRAVQITEATISDAKTNGDQKTYGQSLRRLSALQDLLTVAKAVNV